MNKGTLIGGAIAVLVIAGIGGGIWVATRQNVLPGPVLNSEVDTTAPVIDSTLPKESGAAVEESPNAAMEETSGNAKVFEVVGSSFKFSPTTITVKKGDTVRINFKSSGGMMHNFRIDEFDVATSQLGDEEGEEVEFVANKAGTFEYYCSVGDHRAMGMVGKLVVQ